MDATILGMYHIAGLYFLSIGKAYYAFLCWISVGAYLLLTYLKTTV